MKSMMRRTTIREIWASFGRYMAILAIIALGVGFFAGLKATKPTMYEIVNAYVKNQVLFDYRLICTLGFEEEDVEIFAQAEDVRAAEGSIFTDVICLFEDDSADRVVTINSITQNVNVLDLRVGRMPQAANECVVDSEMFGEEVIGGTIEISQDNSEDTLELMTYDSYTIVGIVASPTYMNFERGSSSIGNGVVSCFAYIPLEGFTADYYSEIYVKMDSDMPIYSQEYKDYIKTHEDAMEALAAQCTDRREAAVIEEAQVELDDAQKELDRESGEAWAELTDAKEQLDTAVIELEEARALLEEQEAEVIDGIAQLEDGIEQIKDGIRKLEDGIAQAQDGLIQVQGGIAQYDVYLEPYETMMAAGVHFDLLSEEELQRFMMLVQGRDALSQQETQLTETITSLTAQKEELEDQQEALEASLAEAQEGLLQVEEGYAELIEAQAQLDLNMAEYEEGLEEYEMQTADAQSQIDEAREELTELADASYYMLGRDTNVGYVCFESDSNIVEEVAAVFPIFFFLVAALVCMTTMNRMVEEQRTQIGILKALGYSKAAIMGKYLIYSGSAALIGCVGGFFAGTYVFPKVIWIAYGMLYSVGGNAYVFDPVMAILALIASMTCSMGTTWLSCRIELAGVAAELIRPKAPRSGKKILLERVTFLWKRMKFLHKVTVRNLFRYKKRFFMMVIGISGCTGLLIAALGLRDSIVDVVNEQYGHIHTYDIGVAFKDTPDEEMRALFEEETADSLEQYFYYHSEAVDILHENRTKSITLMIPKDQEQLSDFMQLFKQNGQAISYPGVGEAVISRKFAERMNIHTGDTVRFRDSDFEEMTVTITGICENYIGDYLYVSAQTYQAQMTEDPNYKNVWCKVKDDAISHEVGTKLMDIDQIASVSITEDMVVRVNAMMSSLNYIIILVAGCAAALAFIVLYNLTNINITERIREIATIKVLGFYSGETASYVFRENIVLTAVGALVGILLGDWLHEFIMNAINVDGFAFQDKITLISYISAVVLTFVFAMAVNGVMYFKLQKIDMAESLKSIE